ncbi:MAG: hypothetical protein IKO43_07085, partial [Kiritimatiellae bacterium]|nr:hypothetical protein [Kiritimatiellia bacterium]
DGETANYFVYTAIRPGPAVKYDYPDEWSAAIRCTVPETANGVVVAFGNVTQGLANRNYIALVAGGTSGEVRLVKGNGNSACESLATMTVAHATSAQHVYVFTKTANAIAVYCDGDLINRVSIECSLTGGFQFGTMYGNFQSGSGLVETTDKETGGTVDYMRLFNYALDEEMIQALADENPYVSDSDTFTRTLSGGESLEWVSEAAWSKGEETAAAPDADGIVEVTAAADSAVSVNLAAAALYEELTIGGEGKVSLLLAEGAATLSATKVDAETDVTVEYGAADFSESRVSIADGKTLTFDFSSEPINGRATRSIVRLTGVTAAPADLGDESAWPVQIVRNSDASSLAAGYDEAFWYDTDTLSYYYAYGPDHDGGAEVYYRDAAYWQNGNPAFAVTNAAGATTVVVAGDTVVIPEYFSGSEAWAADALPANVSKIRIARDFAFHSGVAGAIFDGVEFSVDSGKTLTFSRGNSANGVTLGSATLNGPGAVVLKSIAVSGAVSGSATATVASGTTVSVASGGSVANTLAGTGTVAFATPPTTALSFGDWSGTIELAAFAGNGQHLDFCDHAGAKIKLAGVTGGYLYWEDMTISAEVILAGDFILNDMSAKDYSFTKISGTGNICLAKGGQYELKSFEISEYSGTGAITNNMPNTAVSIGTLALAEGASVAPGTKLLATGGTGAVTVGKVTVGGVEQTGLELATKSDGIYVAGIEPVTPDNIDTYDTTGLNDEDLVLQVTYTPEGGEATTELISGILKVENGAVVLNPAASYEDVSVTPTLDATAAAPIDLSGETAAVFAFKAIAGLWYSVEYSGALAAGGLDATDTTAGETEPEQATATGTATIAAPKAAAGASGLFYRIRAAVKEKDS